MRFRSVGRRSGRVVPEARRARFGVPASPGGTEVPGMDPTVERDGTLLFVGRILPHKGINDFVDALERGMQGAVIGPAPYPAYFEDLQNRACGKRVVFRTDCDDAALVEAYRRAACVVLPSVYKDIYGGETRVPELLGQTLLEAMACGAPAICTDVASLPEVVDHGQTGLVVPPNDPLAQGEECDNRVLLWSDRYRERPLQIQGPGAGADVTAAALLDDVLEIARAA